MIRTLLVAAALALGAVLLLRAPVCSCTYEETALMLGDVRQGLRSLAEAQEAYRAEQGRYASGFEGLEGVRAGSGVSFALIHASDSAWGAVATHRDVSGWCVLLVGLTDAGRPGVAPGIPACRWAAQGHERSNGFDAAAGEAGSP